MTGSKDERDRRAYASDLLISVQKQIIQQTEFINVAAHELRTPIMPILAYAEVLESEVGHSSDALEAIKRNGLRLQHLTENILNVARIDSNTLKLQVEPLDLNGLVSDLLRDRKLPGNVALRFEPSPDEVVVLADRDRINQVLTNLLDNAIKFTRIEVVISVSRNDEQGVVEVRDDGVGIDAKLFPMLFTKFASKSAGGTGLGLYISKGIIEAHGGTITASNNSRYGKDGASFVLTIPLFPKPTPEADHQRGQGPA
jgi:two-component system, OmpR family, sensor histidine kinase VicK